MMNRIVRLTLIGLVVLTSVASALGPRHSAVASDHDEAPLLTNSFDFGATNYYQFISLGLGVTPISHPTMAGVPHAPSAYSDADTILHFDDFIEPGFGSGVVAFEFTALRFVSVAPLNLAFSNGTTAEYDVEVADSPTVPSSGSIELAENSGGTGGFFLIDMDINLHVTFTDRTTGEVISVDGGVEGLGIQMEGSGSYSFDCPAGFIEDPDFITPFCLGHTLGSSTVFPTTFIDSNTPSNPALEWRVVPATAPANPNNSPVLAPIADVTVDEGHTLTVNFTATDVDEGALTFELLSEPGYCQLTDNENGTGQIDCAPGFDDAGTHDVTLTVTDANGLSDTTTFTVTVNDVNRAPIVNAPATVQLQEGEQTTVPVSGSDPDGDNLSFTFEGTDFCLLNDNGDGSGVIQCDPGFDDSGAHDGVVLTTDDGDPALIGSSVITFFVSNSNRPPNINPIADLEMEEGEVRGRGVVAGDSDGDILTITLVTAPPFTTLTDNGGGRADIEFAAGANNAGTYTVTVRVTDNGQPNMSAETSFVVNVNVVDQPPVIDPIDNVEVVQGENVFGTISATDPEGQQITYGVNGPPFCTITANPDGTATLNCDTATALSGTHSVTVTASDGVNQASRTFDLLIRPDIDAQGPYVVAAGQSVEVTGIGPANGTFEWDFDGNGSFEAQGQSVTFDSTGLTPGGYVVTLRVTSIDGTTSSTDTATVTVLAGDSAPVIGPIEDQRIIEGSPFPFLVDVAAEDADGEQITLSATMQPFGNEFLSFTDNGDGTGQVRISSVAPARRYTVTVTASDGGQTDTEEFVIEVLPKVSLGGPYSVPQGASLTLEPSSLSPALFSYDADGDSAFESSGSTFTFFTDSLTDPGSHTVVVKACAVADEEVCSTINVEIEVNPAATFDDLQALTRAAVDNFIVERLLITVLGLAEFFDEAGSDGAARALILAFRRLVISLANAGFIPLGGADEMLLYANSILARYPE